MKFWHSSTSNRKLRLEHYNSSGPYILVPTFCSMRLRNPIWYSTKLVQSWSECMSCVAKWMLVRSPSDPIRGETIVLRFSFYLPNQLCLSVHGDLVSNSIRFQRLHDIFLASLNVNSSKVVGKSIFQRCLTTKAVFISRNCFIDLLNNWKLEAFRSATVIRIDPEYSNYRLDSCLQHGMYLSLWCQTSRWTYYSGEHSSSIALSTTYETLLVGPERHGQVGEMRH